MTNAKLRILEKQRAARAARAERQAVLDEAIDTGNYGILDDTQLLTLSSERGLTNAETEDGEPVVRVTIDAEGAIDDEDRAALIAALELDDAKPASDENETDGLTGAEGVVTPDAAGEGEEIEDQDGPVDYEALSDEQLHQIVSERNDEAETSDVVIDSDDRETIIAALRAIDEHAASTPAEDPTEDGKESSFDAEAHVDGFEHPVEEFHGQPPAEAIETEDGGVVTPDAADPESIADGGSGSFDFPVDEQPTTDWSHKQLDAWAHAHTIELPKGNLSKQAKLDLFAESTKG